MILYISYITILKLRYRAILQTHASARQQAGLRKMNPALRRSGLSIKLRRIDAVRRRRCHATRASWRTQNGRGDHNTRRRTTAHPRNSELLRAASDRHHRWDTGPARENKLWRDKLTRRAAENVGPRSSTLEHPLTLIFGRMISTTSTASTSQLSLNCQSGILLMS